MSLSRIYNLVLAIGLPMLTLSCKLSRAAEDQMVVSVGPYKFQIGCLAISTSWSFNLSVSASPPESIFVFPVHFKPASNNICHLDGVA
ncbi:hypothetical protein D3C85_1482300 [compost metagenome]